MKTFKFASYSCGNGAECLSGTLAISKKKQKKIDEGRGLMLTGLVLLCLISVCCLMVGCAALHTSIWYILIPGGVFVVSILCLITWPHYKNI